MYNVVKSLMINHGKKMDVNGFHGSLILLISLLQREDITLAFSGDQELFSSIVKLNHERLKDSRALLSFLVRKYTETPFIIETTVYQSLKRVFTSDDSSSSSSSSPTETNATLSLVEFLGATTSLVLRNPKYFKQIASRCLRFARNYSLDANGEESKKQEPSVRFVDAPSSLIDRKSTEKHVQSTVHFLVSYVLELKSADSTNSAFSISDVLNALADNMLQSKLIGKYLAKTHQNIPPGFPGCLLEHIFRSMFTNSKEV